MRLGDAVSFSKLPPIDVAGRSLAGELPPLAAVFTASCRLPVLLGLAVLLLGLALRRPEWRRPVAFAVPLALVGWRVSDFCKDYFHRPRPDYWILIHETSYGYSSGHAMFATIVYWLWAWFVWRSALPSKIRVPVTIALALWGCGVIWSRLALGAHYVTDLAGGVLLGIALIAAASLISVVSQRRVQA